FLRGGGGRGRGGRPLGGWGGRGRAGTGGGGMGAPRRARPEGEAAALAHWAGLGAVRLLEDDAAAGVLLLERLHPEVSVRSLPEAKALLEAAGTLRRLWVEPPSGPVFETVAERTGRQAAAMAAAAGDADLAALVAGALAAREELLAGEPEPRLLHGTFRQSKVLAGERLPWLAVGPDPVVGECAFDLARLVRDRVEDLIASPSGASITRRRIKRLAESLEVDQERLRGWTLFRAVESGVRALRVGRPRDAELLLEFAGWV
ncbi:aminoglycoside phosphotransferase family protein, partial [Streptomyces sp. NPDC127079]|uniref:aminoglycoside phosphotransferase family protein n=1 Tax=Streptomyces sp. NPDC127079 TaxID=3347132 RepID=UPI0036517B13